VRVLDLGGGYGEFSAQVLELLPRARVCLADHSVPILDRAKQRLVGFGDRVEFRVCDLRDPAWTTQVGGLFDAVVSSLTIHNLGDPVAIRGAPPATTSAPITMSTTTSCTPTSSCRRWRTTCAGYGRRASSRWTVCGSSSPRVFLCGFRSS
jgi:SAM-dependent methyltransferase